MQYLDNKQNLMDYFDNWTIPRQTHGFADKFANEKITNLFHGIL